MALLHARVLYMVPLIVDSRIQETVFGMRCIASKKRLFVMRSIAFWFRVEEGRCPVCDLEAQPKPTNDPKGYMLDSSSMAKERPYLPLKIHLSMAAGGNGRRKN